MKMVRAIIRPEKEVAVAAALGQRRFPGHDQVGCARPG